MKKVIPFLAFTFLFALAAKAQSDTTNTQLAEIPLAANGFSSDRPGQTYNALTLPKNTWQLQMGVNWGGIFGQRLGLDYNTIGFPIDLRYGITDRLEIMVSPFPSFATPVGTESGIEYVLSSYALSGRFSLFKHRSFGSGAIFGGYQFVNYARGTETGNNTYLKFLYSIPLAKKFSFNTNLGATLSSYQANTFDYTLNFAGPLTEKLGFFVELFGSEIINGEPADASTISYDVGVNYMVSDYFQLDGGFTQAMEGSRTYYSFVGMTYRFN